jgi:hypothetical protein
MAEPAPEPVVLDDAAIEQRLALLDEVLGQLEQMPGRTAELALDAVETLTEVYGEALRRVVAAAERRPALLTAYTSDELLRHLLLLHGIHPDPVAVRAARAVEDLAPHLRSQGAWAQVTGVRDGVAYVTVSSGSCGSCGGHDDVAELVRRHVATMAPDLERIEISAPAAAPAFIPVDTLWRAPVGVAGGSR